MFHKKHIPTQVNRPDFSLRCFSCPIRVFLLLIQTGSDEERATSEGTESGRCHKKRFPSPPTNGEGGSHQETGRPDQETGQPNFAHTLAYRRAPSQLCVCVLLINVQ